MKKKTNTNQFIRRIMHSYAKSYRECFSYVHMHNYLLPFIMGSKKILVKSVYIEFSIVYTYI